MFNAIIIDDEKPALMQLERLLLADGRIRIEGQYTKAADGLNRLQEGGVDVVFLDIDMPGISGIQSAERIQQLDSNVKIVYVTAHSDYALEAFEQHALDYVLKPVLPNRLEKTIDRLEALRQSAKPSSSPGKPAYRIQLFKRLALIDERRIGSKLKWRTVKTQELFAFLLYHKGEWVPKDLLIETIMKEQAGEKTNALLHTSIYHIRKLLKEWGADAEIEFALESYRLRCSGIETDVESFERLTKQTQGLNGEAYRHTAREALALVRGQYLEDHGYDWAEPYREQLHNRHIRLAIQLSQSELAAGMPEEALDRLTLLQSKDPYHEEIVRLRIQALGKLRNIAAIRELYGQFSSMLQAELHIGPEEETRQCYEAWVRE